MHSCILWFSVRFSRVIFIFTLTDAIPKVVKKAKPRSSGWGAEGLTGEIFVFEGFQNDGGGGQKDFVVIELCTCLSLFMDIARICETTHTINILKTDP